MPSGAPFLSSTLFWLLEGNIEGQKWPSLSCHGEGFSNKTMFQQPASSYFQEPAYTPTAQPPIQQRESFSNPRGKERPQLPKPTQPSHQGFWHLQSLPSSQSNRELDIQTDHLTRHYPGAVGQNHHDRGLHDRIHFPSDFCLSIVQPHAPMPRTPCRG